MILYAVILLPTLLGLICAFFPPGGSKKQTAFMLLVQAVITGVILIAVCKGGAPSTPPIYFTETLTFSLMMDPLAAFFCLLTAVCWLLTILYAYVYMKHEGKEPRFYAFLFLTEGMVLGSALAADLMTLYLFYELTTLLSFPLVLHSQNFKALLGASKYLYYSVGGAFLALFGMAVLSGSTSLSFCSGGHLTAAELTPTLMLAIFLTVLGFSAKAGLFPLHNWLPSAHPVAPAPAHALLSGIIAKVGAIAVIRTIYCVVGAEILQGTWLQTVCLCLALVTIFMGSFMGCTENGLKKRLAYSSISQISYVLLGIFILSPLGLTGALLQIFFHAAAKIGVFQSAGAIIYLTDVSTIDRFPGLGKRLPVTMVCFTMLALSLVGIPPFGGFHSKWYLATAALEALPGAMGYVVPAILLASALFTAAYLFSPIVHSFFPGKDFPAQTRVHEPAAMMLSLVVFSVSVLLLGLFPNGVISVMQSIAGTLM